MILINPSALLLISEQAKKFFKGKQWTAEACFDFEVFKKTINNFRSCWLIGKKKGSTFSEAKSY
jgi:hypothetical protein